MHQIADQTVRDELIEWSQPLIADQINRFYFRHFAREAGTAREFAIEHYRLWGHVLRNEVPDATQLRSHLVASAGERGISIKILDDIDRAVLDELMDVILSRFRRTPFIARSYGMTLLDTAANLARARHPQI